MSDKNNDSDHLSHGSSPRWIQEGAKPNAGSKPSHAVKPPASGPAGGAGDSGASSD